MSSPDTKQSLESRHDIEREFHDSKAHHHHHHHQGSEESNFYAKGGMDAIWDAYLQSIGALKDRTILDFGCGEGWSTIEYTKRGAEVYCFDISPESIHNLLHEAEEEGVAKHIRPAVMAAEHLSYPGKTFDLVLGVSILHHTDVGLVGKEVARVLKPGGRALFIEPLSHNIFLRFFRWLTPNRRTPTEQPMSVSQIRDFTRAFQWGEYRGHHLFSIFPQGILWLTGSQGLFKASLRLTETIDRVLLKMFPFLQRYCWAAIIEVKN
jgi:ubiquinone/menaquinone biosynthesis C-methylase UbiE